MSSPINTTSIQQFIQQVKAAELSNQREIKLDIKTAKNLAFCLGEVSARLVENYDKLLSELREETGNGNISISMDGGGL